MSLTQGNTKSGPDATGKLKGTRLVAYQLHDQVCTLEKIDTVVGEGDEVKGRFLAIDRIDFFARPFQAKPIPRW